MIVVTHDFGVAARLCDRVAVMKDGEIIEEGKTPVSYTHLKVKKGLVHQIVGVPPLFIVFAYKESVTERVLAIDE